MPNRQFRFVDVKREVVGDLPQFILWLNKRFKELVQALPGPLARSIGEVGATVTIDLANVDLVQLTLTDDTAITLEPSPAVRAGAESLLELKQDGTGNWAPTWVNATGDGGTIPAPATGAGKSSLYHALYNGTTWVLTAFAANY